jgi:AcrR family transcriptional regulator
MQRSRLLSAAVATIDELGYTHASVASIASRARVSRRTFYELFANREDCLLAVMDDVVARITSELAAADIEGLKWCERLRAGLATILGFFDREPALARVCVVQSSRGGQRVVEHREQILVRLARVVDAGREENSREQCSSLLAEGLVGATVAIVQSRLSKTTKESLSELQGELMGMIVLPYLGASVASRERRRPRPSILPHLASSTTGVAGDCHHDPLCGIPMRLTYRTARVLQVAAENPGASNRVLAEHAEISDQGQVSKLLTRLERLGLLHNTSSGDTRGERNAWSLTPTGQKITQSIHLPQEGLT